MNRIAVCNFVIQVNKISKPALYLLTIHPTLYYTFYIGSSFDTNRSDVNTPSEYFLVLLFSIKSVNGFAIDLLSMD